MSVTISPEKSKLAHIRDDVQTMASADLNISAKEHWMIDLYNISGWLIFNITTTLIETI